MGNISDIERGLPDSQEWVERNMKRNLRLTSDRLAAPMLQARGLSSATPVALTPATLGSSLPMTQTAPLNLFAPPRTQYERNAVYFHTPRVDEMGNIYEAVSRPYMAPEIQESWMRLSNKKLFNNDPTKYAELYPAIQDRVKIDPADYYNAEAHAMREAKIGKNRTTDSSVMAQIMARVETRYPNIRKFHSFTGLQMRKIADKPNLSLHALGNAVDIDADDNPHITKPEEIAVVQFVTGIDLGKSQPRSTLREASSSFQKNFDRKMAELLAEEERLKKTQEADPTARATLKARRGSVEALLKPVRNKKTSGRFDKWKRDGFFNLEDDVINAFLAADSNVVWGGEYKTSKDFMHFEYDPKKRKLFDRENARQQTNK